MSDSICAASDKIAREPEIIPPTTSAAINKEQIIETIINFLIADFWPSKLDFFMFSIIFLSLIEIKV